MAMASSSGSMKYPWPSTVNVGNFVTVKPWLEGGQRSINFKIWKTQMLCLLRSQDLVGFVDGEIPPPPEEDEDEQKQWRRTDELVKGWLLGSIGKDALHAVSEKPTSRDIWLELDRHFKEKAEEEEEDEKDYSKYLEVYQAAQRGEWEAALKFFQGDIDELRRTVISSDLETALHVAVLTGKANDFVKKWVETMPPDTLELQDSYGRTALHNAAIVDNKVAASALVEKNPNLLYIWDKDDRLPVQEATRSRQKETLEYLISQHEKHNPLLFQSQLGVRLLSGIIASTYVDLALNLARKYPKLTLITYGNDHDSALSTIAEMHTLFQRTESFSWWQKIIYHCIRLKRSKSEAAPTTSVGRDLENRSNNAAARTNYSTLFQILSPVGQRLESMIWYAIQNIVSNTKKLSEKKLAAIQLAKYLCDQLASELPENESSTIFKKSIMNVAEYGISEIVEIIIEKFPMVAFHCDGESGMNVFLIAARCRYENVINLIHNMSDRKHMLFDSIDDEGNTLMHMCGFLAPSRRLNLVAGAALQMQRELQWFKAMEELVHPSRRTCENRKGETPQELFTEAHKNLKADGETWMKDTAKACSVATALIATVMFAAAFTVPKGVESAFHVFVVSDAISLFTSITSLLMFLSILTARYAEEDFLYVLPKRLSIGLISLFMSITFMMVAFSVTLYIILKEDRHMAWFAILIAVFACLPVTSFVLLQFPLLVDVLYSTYGPGIFGKKGATFLY